MDDDSEFRTYLSELDSPNTDGYTFFTKNETEGYSLEVYRKYDEVSVMTTKTICQSKSFPFLFKFNNDMIPLPITWLLDNFIRYLVYINIKAMGS